MALKLAAIYRNNGVFDDHVGRVNDQNYPEIGSRWLKLSGFFTG